MRKLLLLAFALVALLPAVGDAGGISHSGSSVQVYTTTLTVEGGLGTNISIISIPVGERLSGIVYYGVYAADAAEHQSLMGGHVLAGINKTGTAVCGDGASMTSRTAVSSGTLSCAAGLTAAGATCVFALSCTSSLAQTTFQAYHWYEITRPLTVSPQ